MSISVHVMHEMLEHMRKKLGSCALTGESMASLLQLYTRYTTFNLIDDSVHLINDGRSGLAFFVYLLDLVIVGHRYGS